MNVQSMSICVPAIKCYNDCVYCCSKMHGGDYGNIYGDITTRATYIKSLMNALEFARDNGCNNLILTGNNEPQQDVNFLTLFAIANNSISKPFRNIEIQTSGALVDEKMITFLRDTVGVTTVAVSTSCINDPAKNLEMVRSCDKSLDPIKVYELVKKAGLNLRVCLNMNDYIIMNDTDDINDMVSEIFNICSKVNADQITFRKLWSNDEGTDQYKWVDKNVTKKTDNMIDEMKNRIKATGIYLGTLEFGANQFDYNGFSVVIDEDSMAQDAKKDAIKYLIFRPDGHLYSRWDSKASKIF